MAYSSFDNGSLRPAEELKIERRMYFSKENADISTLTALPLEQLQTMREESIKAEQAIFENLQESTKTWEEQAGQTLTLNKAIEYVRTPQIQHTSNEWQQSPHNSDLKEKSNSVYTMTYHVYERTRYDRETAKSIPTAWELSWSVRTQTPGDMKSGKIAGQSRKVYADKAAMEKYLNGREKAYAHLFTEISPPIPPEYADCFRVNGQLLPGYTVEGEELKPPELTAADIGGVSISTETEPRKESEPMKDPLNIQLITREMRESGNNIDGAWLKLPATADQLQTALARIGVQGGELEKDYFINGIESHILAFDRIPLIAVHRAGINEMNHLAARLEMLDPEQVDKINAAIEGISETDDIHFIAEYTYNTDFYEHYPDINTTAELGEHVFEKSGLIQIPEAWAGAVDREKLGELAAEAEKGVFTAHGYVVESGAEWKPVTEIPQEYKIAPKIEYDSVPKAEPPTKQQTATTTEPPTKQQAATAAVVAAPFVLKADNPRDKLKEITDKLENGIKGIFESEKYKNYLATLSKFHNYSLRNCLLIAMQKPDATHVAGFNAWQKDFKRQVQKGEKGIKIIAPAPFKAKKEVDKLDAQGKPIIGTDGKHVKEQQEITVPSFTVATVFDVSQTDGEPLPKLTTELTGSVDRYKDFFAAVEKVSPAPVDFEKIPGGAKGYFHREEKRIALNEGMSELQNLKTLIHEIAHARIHDIDKNAPKEEARPDRRTLEVEAESIAYTVCQHYGLDTSDYSFGYVAGWSGGKELDVLKSSLDTIRKEAGAIITEVDKHFSELTQDKQQTAEQTTPEVPAPAVDLKVVADYMQKQYDYANTADPNSQAATATVSIITRRLEQANERIPDQHPQLKALLTNAAQSPDLPTLKERMATLNTDFIQHYSTAVQNTIDTSGKAEPPATPSDQQTDVKAPAQGENVAAIEARVKAGEVINLTDLSDAMKKDKQAQTGQPGKRATAKNGQNRPASKGKTTQEKSGIRNDLEKYKKQLTGQKSAPQKANAQNKNTGLGD